MSHSLETVSVQCPYCWESIEIVVDCSVAHQRYVEDCEVCCRPIVFDVSVGADGAPWVEAAAEDE